MSGVQYAYWFKGDARGILEVGNALLDHGAREIGATGLMGQVCMDLGLFHKSKGRSEQARTRLTQAVECFEGCGAETFLARAREMLASVD